MTIINDVSNSNLKWNFEAFRQYLNFEVLQQAASALMVFDGFNYRDDIADTRNFEILLKERTGLDWSPNRDTPEGVIFDPEGSVFRNKARVFTSMQILDAQSLQAQKIAKLTDFGRMLGSGRISKTEFYEYQIKNFGYPHPAYPDSAVGWQAQKAQVKPFEYLIEVLIGLVKTNIAENRITSKEFLEFMMTDAPEFDPLSAVNSILEARKSLSGEKVAFATEDMRNASDIFGFLCMTGLAFYISPGEISLNLVAISEKDKTHYFFKNRDGELAIEALEKKLGLKGDS